MKSVNLIDCEIIQDLLPSYIDKTCSEAANKLVSTHLKNCKNCSMILNDVNNNSEDTSNFQKEKVNFLKRFNKIITFAFIIILILIIILSVNIFLYCQESKTFYIDLNDISITNNSEFFHDSNEINFKLSHNTYTLFFDELITSDSENNKYLYIQLKGTLPKSEGLPQRTYLSYPYGEFKKIFLEDLKGNTKEIWNEDEGYLIN